MTKIDVDVRYIVTRASDDDTFVVGDRIRLYADGSIGNQQAVGWVDAEDVAEATRGMLIEVDAAWYARRKDALDAQIAALPK